MFHRPGRESGELTIRLLELNRMPLLERRKEAIEGLLHLIDKWHSQPAGSYKDILEREMRREAERDQEFSATLKTYLEASCGFRFD